MELLAPNNSLLNSPKSQLGSSNSMTLDVLWPDDLHIFLDIPEAAITADVLPYSNCGEDFQVGMQAGIPQKQ